MTMTESAVWPPPAAVGPLLPCPFCGGEPTLEPDPWMGESVRIACGNDACLVAPKTEYLLVRFADELRAAWNGRQPCAGEGRGDTIDPSAGGCGEDASAAEGRA